MAAVFVLSVDLELAWGEFYRREVDVARMHAARQALPGLLALLDRRQIRATFAVVVGHLLLAGCRGHDDHPRPAVAWRSGDWFAGDPCTDEDRDPAWYGKSLVDLIARAGHEIGAHGFSHLPLNDPGVSEEVARGELQACARELAARGGSEFSLVYPRNGIMFTNLLKANGFSCYRGVERRWYRAAPLALRKGAHMLDQVLALTPPVGHARTRDGVVEIPSSMLFLSRAGFRRYVPMRSRVARARRGIARSIAEDAVFHLWLHAEDLVPDTERMLAGLDAVLGEVAYLRQRSLIAVRTMAELATAVKSS